MSSMSLIGFGKGLNIIGGQVLSYQDPEEFTITELAAAPLILAKWKIDYINSPLKNVLMWMAYGNCLGSVDNNSYTLTIEVQTSQDDITYSNAGPLLSFHDPTFEEQINWFLGTLDIVHTTTSVLYIRFAAYISSSGHFGTIKDTLLQLGVIIPPLASLSVII